MLKHKSAKVGVQEQFSVFFNNDPEIRVNPLMKGIPLEYYYDDAKTLHEIFMRGVRISGNNPCVGWRPGPDLPFTWITYNNLLYRAKCVGSGLIDLGAKPKPSQFIGIMSTNSLEGVLVKQACNCYSMVIVPFLESRENEMISYTMKLCELKIVVVDTNERADSFLSAKNDLEKDCVLELLVIMEEINEKVRALAKRSQVKLIKFSNLEQQGASKIHGLVPPCPEDLHTISFSSGTTGWPKAIKLSHKNFVSCISSSYQLSVKYKTDFTASDVHFSFFPFAYPVETVVDSTLFLVGGRIGFLFGSRHNLLNDVRELKPTVFVFPQELMLAIHQTIISATSKSIFKSFILKRGLQAKLKMLQREKYTKSSIWDFIVFRKISRTLGGKIRVAFTGGSVSDGALNFMRCVLGVPIFIGYGLTETTSLVTYSHYLDLCPGSVGTPIPSTLIKLTDCTQLDYYVEEGVGEICVKGANVFTGYYKDKTLTNSMFDEDGWFHTGDIGTWLDNGSLKIIDRVKNIFVLSDGHRVTPSVVEAVLREINVIHQIFVYGDNKHDFVVAIVVLDELAFIPWSGSKGIYGDYKTFFDNQKGKTAILFELKSYGEANGLKSYQIPRKVYISENKFSLENDLLTPTFRFKRHKIYSYYENEINEMLFSK